MVSPSTSPLPVAPQSGDTRVTPLKSESSDESAPREGGAVEEEATTKALAPRDEPREAPPAVLPLPENDTESKEGYQHGSPQGLKNPKKKPPMRASGKDRERAIASGTVPSVQDAPVPPSAKEGTKGSGGWYIKK